MGGLARSVWACERREQGFRRRVGGRSRGRGEETGDRTGDSREWSLETPVKPASCAAGVLGRDGQERVRAKRGAEVRASRAVASTGSRLGRVGSEVWRLRSDGHEVAVMGGGGGDGFEAAHVRGGSRWWAGRRRRGRNGGGSAADGLGRRREDGAGIGRVER